MTSLPSRYRRVVLLVVCLTANILLAFYVIPAVIVTSSADVVTTSRATATNQLISERVVKTSSASAAAASVSTSVAAAERVRAWQATLVQPDIDKLLGGFSSNVSASSSSSSSSVFILVCSSVHHIERRRALRATWANQTLLREQAVLVVFVVGRSNPVESSADLESLVSSEAAHHSDILQLNLTDNYVNLTLKTLGALHWTLTQPRLRNFAFVMKCDDDIYLNTGALQRRLAQQSRLEREKFGATSTSFIMGHVVDSARPIRDRRSKWFTPESVYAGEFYPPYVSGTGYVMSRSVVGRLSDQAATLKDSTLFWLEDVFLTGILAAHLDDVTLVHDDKFNFQRSARRQRRGEAETRWVVCGYLGSITQHDLNGRELVTVWKLITHWRSLAPSSAQSSTQQPDDCDDVDEQIVTSDS